MRYKISIEIHIAEVPDSVIVPDTALPPTNCNNKGGKEWTEHMDPTATHEGHGESSFDPALVEMLRASRSILHRKLKHSSSRPSVGKKQR